MPMTTENIPLDYLASPVLGGERSKKRLFSTRWIIASFVLGVILGMYLT